MKRFLAILFTCLLAVPAHPERVTVGGIELPGTRNGLPLKGAGLLRKGLLFKIYTGALYQRGEELQLDIHYFHTTPKKHMISVAEKTLRQNLAEEDFQRHLPLMEKLHRAYLDGKKGSVASLRIHPDSGLIYLFNDAPIITIPCRDFANDYLKIWLGEKPASETMKRALLNENG